MYEKLARNDEKLARRMASSVGTNEPTLLPRPAIYAISEEP
jgi:hypothetical protein